MGYICGQTDGRYQFVQCINHRFQSSDLNTMTAIL